VPLAGFQPPEPPYQLSMDGAPVTPSTIYHKPGRVINWEFNGARREYAGKMRIEATSPYYQYHAVCPDADGFYSWSSQTLFTAEWLFSDLTLPPGGSRQFKQTWKFRRYR